jgi:hypothetical protein
MIRDYFSEQLNEISRPGHSVAWTTPLFCANRACDQPIKRSVSPLPLYRRNKQCYESHSETRLSSRHPEPLFSRIPFKI